MNQIVLNELPEDYLFPFTLTRSILDIRIGILTLREKWEYLTGEKVFTKQEAESDKNIPANILPSGPLIGQIEKGNHFF